MYLGKESPKCFHTGPFFSVLQIKCLSKCPYFKKPPLPWKIPGYAPVSEHKKSNLFRIELIFSCSIIGRFWFFSLVLIRAFKFLLSCWSSLLFIEAGIVESFYFSKTFYRASRFFARRLVPVVFSCKPLLRRFLASIFLLSIISISSWRKWLVSWLIVNAALPSSVLKAGMEITTFHLRTLSVIKD